MGLAAQIPCAKFQTSLRQIHERVSRHLPLGFHKVPLTSAFRATAGRRPSLSPRPVWKFDRTCAEGSIPAPAAGRDVKPQKSLSSPKPAEATRGVNEGEPGRPVTDGASPPAIGILCPAGPKSGPNNRKSATGRLLPSPGHHSPARPDTVGGPLPPTPDLPGPPSSDTLGRSAA